MLQIGNRELTNAVVPVWVSGPFHIEGRCQVERQLDLFTLQLIHNAAVVNAMHRKLTPILFVEQPLSTLLQVEDIDDRNPQVALRGQKIAESLLLLRMDLQQ